MLCLVVLLLCALCSRALHESLNFALPPAARQCFYEDFDQADTATKTVDVFLENGGDVDVLLTIHGPLDLKEVWAERFESPILAERVSAVREVDSDSMYFSHDFKPEEKGTYAFCFDNRDARFLVKNVQLDIRSPTKEAPVALALAGENPKAQEEEEAVARASLAIAQIRKGLFKIQRQQEWDRHRLTLHAVTNINSHQRVVYGSIAETVVFALVSVFQICFVRRWFANRTAPTSKSWA